MYCPGQQRLRNNTIFNSAEFFTKSKISSLKYTKNSKSNTTKIMIKILRKKYRFSQRCRETCVKRICNNHLLIELIKIKYYYLHQSFTHCFIVIIVPYMIKFLLETPNIMHEKIYSRKILLLLTLNP